MRSVVRPRSELFLETPASGSQESLAGGGEGSGGDAHAPCPGGGLRAPALLPAGRGGKAREGEGRERGAETRGGRGFPPHPPPREQRVPAAAPCRPQRPAPRAPPRPREGRRGRRRRRGRGNRSRDLQELTGFLSENFQLL